MRDTYWQDAPVPWEKREMARAARQSFFDLLLPPNAAIFSAIYSFSRNVSAVAKTDMGGERSRRRALPVTRLAVRMAASRCASVRIISSLTVTLAVRYGLAELPNADAVQSTAERRSSPDGTVASRDVGHSRAERHHLEAHIRWHRWRPAGRCPSPALPPFDAAAVIANDWPGLGPSAQPPRWLSD